MKKLKNWLSKYPLWLQCASIFTIVVTLVITTIITNNYIYNKNSVIEKYVSQNKQILKLEMDTVTQYIKELTAFAIQPCYDSRFSRVIETKKDISEDDIDYIKSQMKEYYFTRSDLNSYKIFFMNHNLAIGRERHGQHIVSGDLSSLSAYDYDAFSQCSGSKYFLHIDASDNESDFFTFFHSIIQIDNKSSLAYVRCDIDKDFLNRLIRNYSFKDGEILVLYNSEGQLIYSGDENLVNSNTEILNPDSQKGYYQKQLNNQPYMVTFAQDEAYGLVLISLIPYRVINKDNFVVFRQCAIHGIILWIISVLLIYLLCRWLMTPLNKLAKQLKKVGEGDFNTKIDIGGSSEITNLGNSFNYMSEHIQTLIEENYIVKLNEQSARLIALEAQINPHFLYNTLQAISTEALINDQDQIHEMVISLASILRYSIKGGDFVTLADEMEHVKKYVYLQKIRMEDNLNYTFEIDDDAFPCIIPKISIQTLVENSIAHGMEGLTSIAISIKATVKNDLLLIEVSDNGCGMDSKTLTHLRSELTDKNIAASQTQGIGLANLYARLRIMYDRESSMTVDSTKNVGTTIKIKLPARRTINE